MLHLTGSKHRRGVFSWSLVYCSFCDVHRASVSRERITLSRLYDASSSISKFPTLNFWPFLSAKSP